ncbi:hypothetical protein AJ87_29600 [Rhizobium yanglingense]|nr:hypothetical protein AJ87_29600 [Rhizobium yanglingense]
MLVTSYIFLNGFNVLRPDIAPVVAALFGAIGLIYFVGRFSNAVFAPREPQWRLVRLSNRGAQSIGACLLAMAIVNALDYLFGSVSEAMGSPLVLTVVRSLIAALIIGLILIAASFGRPMLAHDGDPDAPGRHWPRGMAIILRLLGLGLIVTALTGYVGLARFVATQFIITGAIIVTTYIGLLSGKAISKQESFGETFIGRFLKSRFNMGPVAIDQVGLGVGLAIYAVALMTGIPLILLLWGFHIQDLQLIAYRLFTEVRLGGISISLLGIFTGILLFAGGYFLTRWVQRWLEATSWREAMSISACAIPSRPASVISASPLHDHRRFGGRYRPFEPGTCCFGSFGRYRFRPAEHCFEFRFGPDPACGTAIQGR